MNFDEFLKQLISSNLDGFFFPVEKLGELSSTIFRIWKMFCLYFLAAIYKMVVGK